MADVKKYLTSVDTETVYNKMTLAVLRSEKEFVRSRPRQLASLLDRIRTRPLRQHRMYKLTAKLEQSVAT